MNFSEAFKEILNGHKIKLPEWQPGQCLFYRNGALFWGTPYHGTKKNGMVECFAVDTEFLLRTDWVPDENHNP